MAFFWQLDHAAHFFKCLLIVHLETATPLFFRVLYVSWNYLWVFLFIPNNFPGSCGWKFLPDCSLVSTESLIFHYLIRVWTLLIGILNSLVIVLDPFPVLWSSTIFKFNRSFDHSFSLLMAWNPSTSVQHWMKCAGVCKESWNSLLFIHTHWLQADKSQVRRVTFSSYLNLCVCQLVCMLSAQNLQVM